MFAVAFTLGISGIAMAQTNKTEVPRPVQNAFNKQYPGVKPDWDKEGDNYEAEFKIRGAEVSVLFDARGGLLKTEEEMSVNSFPLAAKEYIAMNNVGKVKQATKVIMADGTIEYEAELEDGDLIFASNGKFLRKDKD